MLLTSCCLPLDGISKNRSKESGAVSPIQYTPIGMQPVQRFNEHAYSVRLFIPHGDPDGLRIIDQPNWSGVAVAFPRAAYKEMSRRDEFGRTGIYILVGPGPNGSALATLYIGQSDRIQTRLNGHHKNRIYCLRRLASSCTRSEDHPRLYKNHGSRGRFLSIYPGL